MQFSKLCIVGCAIRDENESLRYRRTAVTSCLEKNRVRTISLRFLHHGYLFG